MERFEIKGENKLFGKISVDSAKNAILPIIAASLLSTEDVKLCKIPNIVDVNKMLQIITKMGGKVCLCDDMVVINNSTISSFELPTSLSKELRSSIFMLGPLLAKYKRARVPFPGGCDIGSRPIDLHLAGLRDLGVIIEEEHGYINCDGRNMRCGLIHLDFPSVGATENLMMASVFLNGETTIHNAAKEPEIVDLANFINKMGGCIRGAGTSTIKIVGSTKLDKVIYTPISDRIITGTYLIAAAMTGGKIELDGVNYEYVYSLIKKLVNSGCIIDYKNGKITLESNSRLSACSFETQPYPGFPTDLQAQMLSLETISDGTSLIVENLFENRFNHVPELLKMGAKIVTRDRMAIVKGVPKLYGAEVNAHDLRGGAALILAGLVARGNTIVHNISYIDRGYDHIENNLRLLGAEISRKS